MLPSLEQAESTLQNLHSAAWLVAAVRQLAFEKQPNYLHLAMKIVPVGVSSDVLPNGGEVTLDMRRLALVYQPAEGVEQVIELEGQTQAALLETLLATIYAKELASLFMPAAGETYSDAMFRAAPALTNHSQPKREHLGGSQPLRFNGAVAISYATALYSIFTAAARFRARLNGTMTPVVVWTEHFDLSFIWFKGEPDESHPHLNFGFAPYSAGIDEPYLYAYAYPYPLSFEQPTLPPGARWHSEGWTGVVLPYAEIARMSDAEGYVEAAYLRIYKALLPLLTA